MNRSRGSVRELLEHKDLATVTDNVSARMLIEPREGVSIDEFLDGQSDDELLAAALEELRRSEWLGQAFPEIRTNEMPALPADVACRLEDELDDETVAVLRSRTRLEFACGSRLRILVRP